MNTIQPFLVPCTGALADLHVLPDPAFPDFLQVYWGTAVLQRVPRAKNSLMFRFVAGLLATLNFRIGNVAEAFEVSEKTVRQWRDGLRKGDWSALGGSHPGLKSSLKLRPDVERYIRISYRRACHGNGGRMPYGFRKQLAEEVADIWPDQDVCEETLRKLFRDEDRTSPRGSGETDKKASTTNSGEATCGGENDAAKERYGGDGDGTREQADGTDNRKSSTDLTENVRLENEKNRKQVCDSSESPNPVVKAFGVEPTRECSSVHEITDMLPHAIAGFSGDTVPSSPLVASCPASENRKATSDSAADLNSNDDDGRKQTCDSGDGQPATLGRCPARWLPSPLDGGPPPPGRCSFPLLSGERYNRPFTSQHAGLLLLAPEFDEALGDLPRLLRQTAAQILCGCVNQEQSKLIDSPGLEKIIGKVVRDIGQQRRGLDRLAWRGAETLVNAGNLRLLEVRSHEELILYGDTHHKEYTGCERILRGWSGGRKKALKGLMMEFFHTADGQPCMIGHYDNFYDGRQRFILLRERLLQSMQPWSGRFIWIHDRGYWSDELLRQIVDFGDLFVQWEHLYQRDGWDEPYEAYGRFAILLQGNSSSDHRNQVKLAWREQKWDRFTNGRRFIIRVEHASGETGEVAVVANHPTMPVEQVIRRMLGRFLQENDFSYLNRHVGINQLTSRKFDRYAAIAYQLQDRDVESRAYKKTKEHKRALQEKLKQCLFTLDRLPAVSLATLEKQRAQLRRQADRVNEQLKELNPVEASDKMIARLSRKVRKLKETFRVNNDQRAAAAQRQSEEATRRELHQKIDEVNEQLAQTARTESRLLMLIEEQYVRPNMDRKALVDAVRITARNVFCQPLKEFRPVYDNYRDDHVVLRALTHAAGIVIPLPDRIDIYLLPRLDRQPEEWDRIALFLRIRERRIEQRFGTRVRFLPDRTDDQMFHAVNQARGNNHPPSDS